MFFLQTIYFNRTRFAVNDPVFGDAVFTVQLPFHQQIAAPVFSARRQYLNDQIGSTSEFSPVTT